MSAETVFLDFSATKLRTLADRIHACLEMLTEEQIWRRGSENQNAVGNLCLHLSGNVRQWILHGVKGERDARHRDSEFAAREGLDKLQLWERLNAVVDEACRAIETLPPSRLTETVKPQSYELTALEAIYHVVEHFAGHAGQIILLTKAYTGEGLGFYKHLTGTTNPPAPPKGEEKP